MTPDELVSVLYSRFRQSSSWPKVRELQIEFRSRGNVRLWAAGAGKENVVCEEGADGVCRVTLRGLKGCSEANADLAMYARAVAYMADSYVKKGPIDVSMSEIALALGLDSASQQRLTALFSRDNRFWSSWQGQGANFKGVPSDDIVFFEGVETLDEIDVRLSRIETEQRQIAELHWGTEGTSSRHLTATHKEADSLVPRIPVALSLRDPRLRSATMSDLNEIAAAIHSGAWKAAAVLAGACLEALLLDLWFRHEEVAKSVFKKRWPNSVGLNDLAEAALEHELISQDLRSYASAMTRARNLVHPLRAGAEPAITPAFVDLLLSTLRLLNEELGADSE